MNDGVLPKLTGACPAGRGNTEKGFVFITVDWFLEFRFSL